MRTIVESHDQVDHQAWDRRLASMSGGAFFQSTAYGALCHAAVHEQPVYARVEDDGQVLGQLLWFKSYWARERVAPMGARAAGLWRHLAPARQWECGPIIFDARAADQTTRELLRVAASAGSVRFGMPAVHGLPDQSSVDAVRPAEWNLDVHLHGTLLLDVTKPLDALWQGVSPDGKRNVRRAAREKLTISEVTDAAGLSLFYDVYAQTYRRQRFTPKPLRRIAQTRELMGNAHHVFLSFLDGTPVSAQAAIVWNGIVTLSECSISDFGLERGLHGNDLMQWHLIEWANAAGARLIDWSGYSLKPTPKQEGINRFKSKWGGRLYTYNTYYRVPPALRASLKWYRGERSGLAAG